LLSGPSSQPAFSWRPMPVHPIMRTAEMAAAGDQTVPREIRGGPRPFPGDSGFAFDPIAPALPSASQTAGALTLLRLAPVSPRLGGGAGRLPLPLVLTPATPSAGWSPAIRLGPVTTLAPSGVAAWEWPGIIGSHGPATTLPSVESPLAQGAAPCDLAFPVSIPGALSRVNRRASGPAAFSRSTRRIAELADAQPLEFLARGSRSPASEYRTLFMLSGALPPSQLRSIHE
jgi:hypothetical protein